MIGPGTYWYSDQETGLPRKLDVNPELTKYWCDQGNAMLSDGLTVPVPCEHDFTAHPMTPADKLKSNAGWVKEYRMKGDKLYAVTDILNQEIYSQLPHTIRWTSPWINSFTDGKGKQWNNVISHLALTTRPRITNQAPFPSIAAALSMATSVPINKDTVASDKGFFLSRATRLVRRKDDKQVVPLYPIAFSLISGVSLAEGDIPPKKKKPPMSGGGKKPPTGGGKPDANPTPGEDTEFENPDGSDVGKEGEEGDNIDLPPLGEKAGDVSMEEVLCDLLRALGVNVEHNGDESQFKRNLYAATMQKVHELTNKGMNKDEEPKPGAINKDKPPGSPGAQPNPLIQQEQQPMYMSMEEINKLPEPNRSMMLSVYNDNVKLKEQLAANEKLANSLRDKALKEAATTRASRVANIIKIAPNLKSDLEALLSNAGAALSMGDGGAVVDPLAQTLAVLEKGLANIPNLPKLLTTDSSALSAQPHPTDEEMLLTAEQEQKVVDDYIRMMGCPPEAKKAS